MGQSRSTGDDKDHSTARNCPKHVKKKLLNQVYTVDVIKRPPSASYEALAPNASTLTALIGFNGPSSPTWDLPLPQRYFSPSLASALA